MQNRRSLRPWHAALIFGLLGLLAACGGDDAAQGTENPGADVLDNADIDADEGDTRSAAGGGSIRAGAIAWPFEGDVCFSDGSFLQVSGSGTRADGVPFFAEIVVNDDEDSDGDGTPDPSGSVILRFGTDSDDDAADGEADYEATLLVAGTIEVREFEYELVDGYVTGTGEITDFNGVETEFGEYVALEFEGGCG